jgi:hypothetical protein
VLGRALLGVVVVAGSQRAAASPVAGVVESAASRWTDDGELIVTELTVRAADGSLVQAVQPGGSVGGIGMTFSHVPAPPAAGDRVALTVDGVARLAQVAAAPGVARYGLQRTTRSSRPLWHDSSCLAFAYDAAGSAKIAGAREWEAVDRAFEAWSVAAASCSGLAVARERVPGAIVARDGVNSIAFRDARWCRPATATEPELCYPREASAVTRAVFVDDPDDPRDGTILEADIEINAVDFVLGVDGAAPVGSIDVASIATHEIGHALGLAHNCGTGAESWPTDRAGRRVPACAGATAEVAAATMYYSVEPGATTMRTLESADRTALCAALDGAACASITEGGCTAGGGGSLAALALVGPLARRRRRLQARTRSSSIDPAVRQPCDQRHRAVGQPCELAGGLRCREYQGEVHS